MSQQPRTPRGPADPERPDRIARAALQVIQSDGIPALTHRVVARRAGVPLGSTSYYFSSKEDLIAAAMRCAVDDYRKQVSDCFTSTSASSLYADLGRFVADKTTTKGRRRGLAVSFDLYLRALHQPNLRAIGRAWDDVLLNVLQEQVAPRVATSLCALASGLWLRALIEDAALTPAEVVRVLSTVDPLAD